MISSRVFLRSMRTSTSMMLFHRSLSFTSAHQSQTSTKLKEQTSNSSTPIPSPSSGLHDPKKIYSEKIQRLAEEISKLSLVDVMDLNELLKVRFTALFFVIEPKKKMSKFPSENVENPRCSHHGFNRWNSGCCSTDNTSTIGVDQENSMGSSSI